MTGYPYSHSGSISVMASPVKKLSDRFADYDLRIRCKKCGHERITEPHVFGKIMGWETPLVEVAKRLRCSKCHSRGACEMAVIDHKKPRGYRSH
jgi:hypothetical protein